jgi:hypothetical protein
VRFERQFLRKDNEVVPVEVSLSTAGEDQYQAVLRNISDRKKAEQELRKQADLLRLGPRCHHRARSGKPDQILERGGGEDLRLDGDGSHR